MRIAFDPAKRTLRERGLEFEDALRIFAGPSFTFEDDRFDYPEVRFLTVGLLRRRMIVMVWSPDPTVTEDEGRRVISMRKANVREQRWFADRLGQARRDHG